MKLAGSLESTTLGDLFGVLHRERVSGTLELEEEQGPTAGRLHRVHFRDGRIVGVESRLGARPLGELLVEQGALDEGELLRIMNQVHCSKHGPLGHVVMSVANVPEGKILGALRKQRASRLEALFTIRRAKVRFRVPRRIPSGCRLEPMSPLYFLHGRQRARDSHDGRGTMGSSLRTERESALARLGLGRGATDREIRRAFRRLAASAHPDRHRGAAKEAQARIVADFAELSYAYHKLAG